MPGTAPLTSSVDALGASFTSVLFSCRTAPLKSNARTSRVVSIGSRVELVAPGSKGKRV